MRLTLMLLLLIPAMAITPNAEAACSSQLEDTACTVQALRNNSCQAINVFCQEARLRSIVGGFADRTCDRQLGPAFCP